MKSSTRCAVTVSNFTNNLGVSPVFLDVIKPEGPRYAKSDYSVTQLIKPPRILQLERRHKESLTPDVAEFWNVFIGKSVHGGIEKGLEGNDEYVVEGTLAVEIDGKTITGTYDCYHKPTKTLMDHKMISTIQYGLEAKDEYITQLNVYAYLLETAGICEVEKLALNVVYLDWRKAAAKYAQMQGKSYPPAPARMIPLPKWPREKVEAVFKERLAMHIQAETLPDDKLPHCTAEEVWESPAKMAVVKQGALRSSKNCANMQEAMDYVKYKGFKPGQYWIDYRPATRKRCEMYCPVSHLCNQYKEWKDKNNPPQTGEVPF